MKKRMFITGLAFAMSVSMCLTAYADWQQEGTTWSYVGDDGLEVPGARREYLDYSNQMYGDRVMQSVFADMNHDGLAEFLVVVGEEQCGGESELVILTIKDNQVIKLGNRGCNNRNAYYLYEQDEKQYILGTTNGIYQGRGSYQYEVLYFAADGTEKYLDSGVFEISEPSEYDRQYNCFYEKIRPYVERGQVLFNKV